MDYEYWSPAEMVERRSGILNFLLRFLGLGWLK